MKKLFYSFKHAFTGLFFCLAHERNMRIHICFCAFVTLFGFICKISLAEWIACIAFMGIVLTAELFNTAIELAVDKSGTETSNIAKIAKDASAAAVLVCAIAAAVCGLLIFAQKERIMMAYNYYCANPLAFVLLILALICAICFVALTRKGTNKK